MKIILITTIAILFLILFFLFIIKPNQNEKIDKKTKGKGKVVAPDDRYAEVIDDYPTYTRNQQN